jgi:hypothetical protein
VRRKQLIAACAVVALAASRGVAAPEAAIQSDALVESIGINIHAGHYLGYGGVAYNNWNAVIDVIGDLGVRYVRDHSLEYQRLNDLSAATGVKIIAISEWQDTSTGAGWRLKQSELSNVMARTKALKGLAYVEGPNELEEYGDPNWLANLEQWMSGLYRTVKNDPVMRDKPVIAPSMFARPEYTQFAAYSDIGNIHAYPAGVLWNNNLEYRITGAQSVAGPGKPVFATESGYSTAFQSTANDFAVNESAQAKYVPRLIMEYYNRGIRKTVLYELADDNPDPDGASYQEIHFGLLRSDLSFKPAAVALKNLIARLADAGEEITPGKLDYTLSGAGPDVHYTLLQKRDGKFVLALWQNVLVYDNANRVDISNPDDAVSISLNMPIASAKLYGLDQSAPLATFGAVTQLNVNVPDSVVLLELTPAAPTAHDWTAAATAAGAQAAWSAAGNWNNNAPAGAFAEAYFGDAAGAGPRGVNVDGARSVGAITFNHAGGYTLSGSGVLTIDTPAFGSVRAVQGSDVISAPLQLARDTTFDVANAAQLTLTNLQPSPVAFVNKTGLGTLVVNRVAGKGLHVLAGRVRVAQNGSAAGVSVLNSVSVAAGAALDLTNNALVVRGTDGGYWNGTNYTGVSGQVQSGLNRGTWNGSGIITSMADALNFRTTLAVVGAGEALGLAPTATRMWRGQIVTGSDALVMYTYAGDLNVDGAINADDYASIDLYSQMPGASGYLHGDINYDGRINADDYPLIDLNVTRQGGPFEFRPVNAAESSLVAVPEPGMIGVAALGLLACRRRRREQRSAVG